MGMGFKTLNFAGFGDLPFPTTDQIIRNVRTNTGLRTPLLDREDLRNVQQYRMNPFGMARGGWTTSGFDAIGVLNAEDRYRVFAQADWQANRFRFRDFAPWRLRLHGNGPPQHIRLDQALETLIGDRLQ